jgi:hypothetical protein
MLQSVERYSVPLREHTAEREVSLGWGVVRGGI